MQKRQTACASIALSCALALSVTTANAQEKSNDPPQKIVKEGIEVEFTIEPLLMKSNASAVVAGEDSIVRFKIRDTATRTPLSKARPAAWISQRERPMPLTGDQCRSKVQSFLQGSLRVRPDVDLNAYYVLALNKEPNISVIDPLLGFGGSKLITLVFLKSPGEDWVLTNDGLRLFVSMPLVNQVAVVDTNTWKVVAHIDAGVRPTRLALQPDEKYLWIGNNAQSSDSGVTVVETASLKVAKYISTGAGPHDIAFGLDNRFAFITNRDDATFSIVDIRKLTKVKDAKLGTGVFSLAFSPLSNALYITDDQDGSIAVIDAVSHNLLSKINAKPGLKTVRFSPSGRWGFVANPAESVVHIFDASNNQLLHEYPVGKAPDHIAFSDGFAYVRSLETEQVTAIRLSTIGKQLDVVKFPGGQAAPGSTRVATSNADAFVAAPESGSMLLANPADKMIYYFAEGMAAPMGNFQNYGRVPRAVKVVDRSLREESPGVYKALAKLPKDGLYDVSLLLDSPRVVHCFEASAQSNPAIKGQNTALRVEYLNKQRSVRTGEEFKIRFRLTEKESKRSRSDLKDVAALVMLTPGTWRNRELARSIGDGVYELTVKPPDEGIYLVFIESRSQGIRYRELPHFTLHATAPMPHSQQ